MPDLRCHPAQLRALIAASLVEEISDVADPDRDPLWITAHNQRVAVDKHLPEEGLFLPGSKAVREAEKIEAGDARRREQLRLYHVKRRDLK